MLTAIFLVQSFMTFNASASPADWVKREEIAGQVQKDVLRPWKKSWLAQDASAFSALFSATSEMPDLKMPQEPVREFDGIKEYQWDPARPVALNQKAVAGAASGLFASFSKIEDLDLGVLNVSDAEKPEIRLRYDLRGKLKQGALRTDRGILNVEVVRSASGFKIARIERVSMETLTAAKPVFEDVSKTAGLDRIPVYARQEAIRRGGYALAVGDFDGDGLPDFYVGGRGAGQLFRNQGDGTFKDVTREAGLKEDTLVKSAVFGDFDNSGRQSLILQRFVDDPDKELVFYKNVGAGKFVPALAVVKRTRKHDRPMSMAAADFNGDGFMDLYVGYPGSKDFTDSRIDTTPGLSHQAVYINKGNWKFEEAAGDDAGQSAIYGAIVRPHAAVGVDLTGSGQQDLIVADDRGEASRLYMNMGGGRFKESQDAAGLENRGWGMMAVVGDFAGRGQDSVYFSNIDLSAGHRIMSEIGDGSKDPGYDKLAAAFKGNKLYEGVKLSDGHVSFKDVTEKAGVGWAGEAPAGAEWVDYNNDGVLDLFVSNGLWSADPDNDYDSEFVRKELKTDPAKLDPKADPNEVMKYLQRSGRSFAGYQRKRLFRGNGDGTFTEVGYVTGADRIEDGYVVAFTDFNRDGKMDLLLRNADPPSLDRPYRPVILLKNNGDFGNKSLAVYLQGITGSAAHGARVTVKANGRTQVRGIRSVQGAVQSEAVAFFGLGKAEQADVVEVRWPSGIVDKFKNVKAGRILVKESETTLSYITSTANP